jgi:hypothetical protein
MKDFTAQQKEIVARKLGYDGPMQGFDDFISSSPALEAKYAAISGKFIERMAKGGLVKMKPKGYAYGGPVYSDEQLFQQTGSWEAAAAARDVQNQAITAATLADNQAAVAAAEARGGVTNQVVADWWSNPANQGKSDVEIKAIMDEFKVTPTQFAESINANLPTALDIQRRYDEAGLNRTGGVTQAGGVTLGADGKPTVGNAAQVTAAQITTNQLQNVATANRADDLANTGKGAAAITASTAAAPTAAKASTYEAQQTAGDVRELLKGVSPAVGTVGASSQVAAQTVDPTKTALAGLTPATLAKAQTVEGAPTRTLKEGEQVSAAVDAARAEATAKATEAAAAQGTVTEDMTVQGQLAKLTANFDAKNPPPWAAAALREATAVMAARGIGASSLAGQALVQATFEKALPIATADAAIFQQMGLQNLSNKQQTAVLAAQQRATFLGQEFDQTFQARVTNAAKISDIANLNFTATQQIALENSKMAQTVDLANLSNQQATIMAYAAQVANLEVTNLTNKQQAAVVNAQAFLQMDLSNLSNQQQTILFKTQQMTNSLLSDSASMNASLQFNAASKTQVDQFNNTLSTQVTQFNATQKNAIAQFNTDQENAMSKFNAEVQNQRDTFNATQRLVIDQSNAQWQRDVATANTAAVNAANTLNAQLSQNMTLAEYNNETQLYRDTVSFAWQAGQNDSDRANKLSVAQTGAAGQVGAAKTTATSNLLGTAAKAATMFLLSDERMKDIHGPITNALDKIKEIGGYSYNYKVDAEPFGYSSTITTMGVLAGQVKKVLPDAVKPAPFNVGFDVVDYAAVNGLLVAAVNELITKVDLLSTRLNDLEKK